MSTNSDLKKFAVFINSKAATIASSEKSRVSIPFVSNLAYHENMKVFKFGMVDMLFTNSFYNIRPGVSTLKILTTFAAGRGQTAAYVVQTVNIPYAFYSIDDLDTYLSIYQTAGIYTTQSIQYAGGSLTSVNSYTGFGELNSYTDTAGAPTSSNPEAAKIIFNSASLEQLLQVGTDLNTVPTINTFTTIPATPPYSSYSSNYMGSGIISGVYLIADSDTEGILHMFGIYTTETLPTIVPNFPQFSGYGYAIGAKIVNVGGNAYSNTTVFTYVSPLTGAILNPTTASITTSYPGAAGVTYTSLTPSIMTDLSGLDEVYIHCAQMRTSFLSSTNRLPLSSSDVIAVIPINVSFGSKMSWVPNFEITATLLNTNITQLDFTLTNSNNELLNFNGINWSMTLHCQEEMDESKFQQEDTGTLATPFQFSKNLLSGTSYMEESHNRQLLKRSR